MTKSKISRKREKILSLRPKIPYLGIFRLKLKRTVVKLEISTLKSIKNVFPTNIVKVHFFLRSRVRNFHNPHNLVKNTPLIHFTTTGMVQLSQVAIHFVGVRYSVGESMFKDNNRNTRRKCEICPKLTIKTPERHQWCHSGVFIVTFEHISDLFLVFLLLTLSR